MRASVWASGLVVCLVTGLVIAQADDAKSPPVAEIVGARDFWEAAGRRDGRKWSEAEVAELRQLATQSKDGAVRLRAGKVLVDLAGKSRYDRPDEAIVTAAFRYLEMRLQEAPIRKLCAEQGFTHYGVSRGANGDVWFLIEHVQSGGFNGGLNLTWDRETKRITTIQGWGDVPQL